MELFTLDAQLEIGHNLIDSQHKDLVLIFNKLYHSFKLGRDRAENVEILLELASHTVKHFATEEELMLRYGYPYTQPHKAEHDRLVEELINIKVNLEKKLVVFSFELLQYIKNWLTKHILTADMELGVFLQLQDKINLETE